MILHRNLAHNLFIIVRWETSARGDVSVPLCAHIYVHGWTCQQVYWSQRKHHRGVYVCVYVCMCACVRVSGCFKWTQVRVIYEYTTPIAMLDIEYITHSDVNPCIHCHSLFIQHVLTHPQVSWLPQYHDMGLIGSCLGLLYCGGKGVSGCDIGDLRQYWQHGDGIG